MPNHTCSSSVAYTHLQRAEVSVLIKTAPGLPQVIYWGSALNFPLGCARGPENFSALQKATAIQKNSKLNIENSDLFIPAQNLEIAGQAALASGIIDQLPVASVLPEESAGWPEEPGLVVSRQHRPLATKFTTTTTQSHTPNDSSSAHTLEVLATDTAANLELNLKFILHPGGIIEIQPAITNLANSDDYCEIRSLSIHLPVPASETEVFSQTGHHLRERAEQRHQFTMGVHTRTIHCARAHTGSTLFGTVSPSTNYQNGSVHLIHLGWSGNQRVKAIANPQGFRQLAGGEIFEPGEGLLAPGATLNAASLFATCSNHGLDQAARRFHHYLRSLPNAPKTPRPITLNAWEAIYFEHSWERVKALVEVAAKVGIERFVLDDGWFGSRRDDTKGLGDWFVSPEVWPNGLRPLADLIHSHGMQFGLWFEPEMINEDSDLARAHPDWIMGSPSHLPLRARFQQVLNLTNPQAYAYIESRLTDLIAENQVDYIKWDYNRDLYEALDRRTGKACYREQTLATYRLLAHLRKTFPTLEIESCAGGGGRIDLGIMQYCQRIWASDCIDPLERQAIEAGTSLLLPPEFIGSHVASNISHTTGRAHKLSFRAATAIFSHMGVEWDLTKVENQQLEELASWIARYRELRGLLHSGDVVHLNHSDPAYWGHGVVDSSQDQAIFAISKLSSSVNHPGTPIQLAGLDPQKRYRVWLDPLTPDPSFANPLARLPWGEIGLELDGHSLQLVGLQPPLMNPETTVLIHLESI